MARRRCKAMTRAGARCKNAPVEAGLCLAHAPRKVGESRGFGGPQPGSGRPAKPRVADVMRERVEASIDKILAPYFEALEHAVIFDKIDGRHEPTAFPDVGARIDAAEKLQDRVYGRPRQVTELAGEGGGPLQVSHDVDDPEVRKLAHELLRRRFKASSE